MASESNSTMAAVPSSPAIAPGQPEIALLFIGVSFAVGAFCRQLLQRTRIPYTVALLLIGVGLGALEFYEGTSLGILGTSIKMWANINPHLVLYVFLPALLFESSFAFEVHQIKRCILQMFLLAGPGVALTTGLLGVVAVYILPYGWSWSTGLLLGGVLSATDPVAVVALLKELGASKKLSTIIDGEALMNDGTAIVVFQLFLKITLGYAVSPGSVIIYLLRVCLGGVALGMAFAIVTILWLRLVFNDYVIEITLTLTSAYMAFFVANDVTDMSGVLSDMTLGIMFAIFAKTAITGESETAMHHFWEMVSYMANTLIFMLSGVVIAEKILAQATYIQGADWGYVVLLYVFVQLTRAIIVLILYPGLGFTGYGLDWKEALVLIWAGLRGAVALTLALLISQETDYEKIPKETQARFMFLTGGVVFLTLIVNGTTTQFLVAALKMNKTSDIKKRIQHFTRQEMYAHALKTFEDIGDDEELGPADWTTVKAYLPCLDQGLSPPGAAGALNSAGWMGGAEALLRPFHPHHPNHPHHPQHTSGAHVEAGEEAAAAEEGKAGLGKLLVRLKSRAKAEKKAPTVEVVREQQLQDTRLRFLNGVQASYWSMLEEGRVTQTAAILLMQAVAEAMDHTVKHHQLGLWAGLKPHVRMPLYLRELHQRLRGVLPARALDWVTLGRLELAASMSAAFLRASRHARQQLKSFLKDSPICDHVIVESEEEEVEAKKFLEDLRLNFPEVLTNIKTKQVIYAILLELKEYVGGLESAGLLEGKETLHLQAAVDTDWKRLLRKPPLVAMLPAAEVLQRQPLIGALPGDVRSSLVQPMKEFTKLAGSVLFEEGEEPDGVWLIASGVAKWSSESRVHLQSSLCPHFAHGTTVGLYESLLGIRRLSTVAADSVLHCFFIDRQRMLQAAQSSNAVADFLWKESALELARVLLPEMVGDISQHDLRMLMHGPTTSRFLSLGHGACVSLAPSEIGLLLMGSLELLLPSPAVHSLPSGPTRELHSSSSAPSTHEHTNGDSGAAAGGANGVPRAVLKDNEIFTTAISAPARLSYVSHGASHGNGSLEAGAEPGDLEAGAGAGGGLGRTPTPASASAPQVMPRSASGEPESMGMCTPGEAPGASPHNASAHDVGSLSHQYLVLSPAAKLLVINATSRAELDDDASTGSTSRRPSLVLLPPRHGGGPPQDHDALLRWDSSDSPGSEEGAGEGVAAADYENTLPPASLLAEQLRQALDVDNLMTQRALQLSVYGSKLDLRPQGHAGSTVTRRGSHHGGSGAAGSTHRRRHRSSQPQAPTCAADSGHVGGHPSAVGVDTAGLANKSMHALPLPKSGWSSLEARHTSSETNLKQVEKLGKPLLFESQPGAGGASPGEGEAEEEDVALAIDSPSKLFGGAGHA